MSGEIGDGRTGICSKNIHWLIEELLPELLASGYEVTSAATSGYNCVAWAAGDDTRWWGLSPGDYWPDGIPRSTEPEALTMVFAGLGYEICDGSDREAGYEKVAIYVLDGGREHAARQLDDGQWTSKLGPLEDITHPSPKSVAGEIYGEVHCIMRRPLP